MKWEIVFMGVLMVVAECLDCWVGSFAPCMYHLSESEGLLIKCIHVPVPYIEWVFRVIVSSGSNWGLLPVLNWTSGVMHRLITRSSLLLHRPQ